MQIQTHPSFSACYHYLQVSKGSDQKQPRIKLQAMQDAPPLQLYPASDKFSCEIKGKLQSTCKVSKGLA